jgi:hypothetical protein
MSSQAGESSRRHELRTADRLYGRRAIGSAPLLKWFAWINLLPTIAAGSASACECC